MPRLNDSLLRYLSAGWTWLGPTEVDGSFELRAKELPDFFVAAPSRAAVLEQLGGALEAYFLSYIEHNCPLPQLPDKWVVSGPQPVDWVRRQEPRAVSGVGKLLTTELVTC